MCIVNTCWSMGRVSPAAPFKTTVGLHVECFFIDTFKHVSSFTVEHAFGMSGSHGLILRGIRQIQLWRSFHPVQGVHLRGFKSHSMVALCIFVGHFLVQGKLPFCHVHARSLLHWILPLTWEWNSQNATVKLCGTLVTIAVPSDFTICSMAATLFEFGSWATAPLIQTQCIHIYNMELACFVTY